MVESIQVIEDGDSMALLGDLQAIDKFLQLHHLQSSAEPISPHTERGYLSGLITQVLSDRALSGRWVRPDQNSPKAIRQYNLQEDQETGLSAGTILVREGREAPGGQLFLGGMKSALNPVMLTNIGALIAQYELQQAMQSILKYLHGIEKQVDDILRAQKDTVLTNMVGINLIIEDALSARNQIGHVSQTSWDKVQTTSLAIAQTQAYAVRQVNIITEKIRDGSDIHGLSSDIESYREQINEWLAVLARSLQLQDASTILELDRVAQVEPDELNLHRQAVKASRDRRVNVISESMERLLNQLNTSAQEANQQVLLHPQQSPHLVQYCNLIKKDIVDFGLGIGLDQRSDTLASRPWLDAARETTNQILENSKETVDTARDLGVQVIDRTKELGGQIGDKVSHQSQEIIRATAPKERINHLLHLLKQDNDHQ